MSLTVFVGHATVLQVIFFQVYTKFQFISQRRRKTELLLKRGEKNRFTP